MLINHQGRRLLLASNSFFLCFLGFYASCHRDRLFCEVPEEVEEYRAAIKSTLLSVGSVPRGAVLQSVYGGDV